ncbi:hypothetical protein JCM19275_3650 [Nonlabens ulvanivorans]|uniref:GYF domain-containing protein n=1 Tax=Nonlabens ulvanivorans TaxID=906888 RepID=A0A090WLH8_NONUL|nr:hypothetical protein [Nonlabens ulvanivorans]GAL77038.1 hypothetical protein JCM19275_3650 [Nonlabens ulvanivorans]
MIHYYYSDGINEFGPFHLNELKEKALRPDFKIRTENKSFVAAASSIAELDVLFQKPAAAVQNVTFHKQTNLQPATQKSSSDKLLIATLILWLSTMLLNAIVSAIFSYSYSSNSQYIFLGLVNLISAALPLLIALSIQDKTLKVIGIIISVILMIRFIFGAVQLMTFSF